MLNILLYQDSDQLWGHLKQDQTPKQIVCPSPQIADAVRKRVPLNIQVQTMANFISELSLRLDIDQGRIKGKSELMFYLSQVSKKQFHTSHQEFLTAFHLFTQLRGVSQDEKLIETVLEDYVPQLKDWVLGFYRVMEQLGWLDEHGSYKEIFDLISTNERSCGSARDFVAQNQLVFYGFKHFTGTQVELFKGLSHFCGMNIIFPYWKQLYKKSWPTDWIQWFADEAIVKEAGDFALNKKQQTKHSARIKVYETSSAEFSSTLRSILSAQNKVLDIMIPEKSLEASHIMMIPHNHLQFKMSYDLFDLESLKIQTQLETINSSVKRARQTIYQKVQEIDFSQAQDFREFKLLSIVDEILDLYPQEDNLEAYDWKIIFEILKLDIPRLNLTSFFSEEKSLVRLLNRQDIDDSTIKSGSFLLLNNSTNIFGSVGDLYSEKVEKHISSLSPMRRPDVENQIFINQLIELIQNKEMIILRGDGLIEKEPRWESFFSLLDYELLQPARIQSTDRWILPTQEVQTLPPIQTMIEDNSEYFSATRIQSYLDCHYYYYFKYIKNIFPNFNYETQLEPREIGSLEHLVIATYCERNKAFEEKKLRQLCEEILNSFLIKEGKRLDQMVKASILEEIFVLSQRGIELSFNLSNIMKLPRKAIFERGIKEEFPGQFRSGSIDYSYWDSSQLILVDFKRGGGSIPSATSIKEFEKIQFLFYLNVVTKKYEKLKQPQSFFMGYFCLADMEKSRIWADDDLQEALVSIGYPPAMFKKGDIFEMFDDYPQWEDELVQKINAQQSFKPNPRDKNVCSFCDLNTVCHKGAL